MAITASSLASEALLLPSSPAEARMAELQVALMAEVVVAAAAALVRLLAVCLAAETSLMADSTHPGTVDLAVDSLLESVDL